MVTPDLEVRHPPQIGVVCDDLDAMIRFYTEGLGLPVLQEKYQPPGMDRFVCVVGVGTSFLKLWGFERKPWSRSNPPKGPAGRYDQIGLRYLTIMMTTPLADVLERLESLGCPVTDAAHPGRTGFPVTVSFVQDPDGNWLELMQLDDPDWWPYAPVENAEPR